MPGIALLKRHMRYLFTLLLTLPLHLYAQQSTDWSAFFQRIDAKTLAGKRFKLQAAAKVEKMDADAVAGLWARVDKSENKTGFFYNMMDRPISSNQWKEYSFEGRIDKDAEYLNFGGLYFKKGRFYFDDFKLLIETTDNKFEEYNILNGSFENDSLTNWVYSRQSTNFIPALTNQAPYAGKTSLVVDSRNAKKTTHLW